MKPKTKTMLAAAIFGLIAFAGNSFAQTVATGTVAASPSPSATPDPRTGTFQDPKETVEQRLTQAQAVLTSGTDAGTILNAAKYMLQARPVIHAQKVCPGFADKVLADTTLGGLLQEAHPGLATSAVAFNADCMTNLDQKIAYLNSQINSKTDFGDNGGLYLTLKVGYASVQKANGQLKAFDYDGAIATITPVLGHTADYSDVSVMFKAKLAKRDADVLSWAKLVYFIKGFNQTQDGIDAESSAFRALDTNVVRMNANVDFQKTGTGTDLFASIPLPQINFIAQNNSARALDKAVSGDMLGALKLAVNVFSSAPTGPQLNNATSFVAQWLRNKDGNFVRANAFIQAQTSGQPYTIAELAQ